MKSILLSAMLIAAVGTSRAADWYVNQFGTGGAFSSISSAIAAAAAGDRILIQPRSGGASYVENLVIDKPLELLSSTDATQFVLTGSVTFNTLTAGAYYAIIGMYNLTGDLSVTAGPASGSRARLNILGCRFASGNLQLAVNNTIVTMANSQLDNGLVSGKFLHMYGNTINTNTTASNSYCVSISSDATVSSDTINIIGNNFLFYNSNSSTNNSSNPFTWTNSSQYFNICNNYVRFNSINTYSPMSGAISLYNINSTKTGTGGNNFNNNSGTGYYGIYNGVYFSVSATMQMFNNVINTTGPGFQSFVKVGSGPVAFSYNFCTSGNTLVSNIVNDGTNFATFSGSINTSNGSSSITNTGYPDPIFNDLDLSRNDIGTMGGPFSQSNYGTVSGSTRVYYLNAPRSVNQGGMINIQAEGYDR